MNGKDATVLLTYALVALVLTVVVVLVAFFGRVAFNDDYDVTGQTSPETALGKNTTRSGAVSGAVGTVSGDIVATSFRSMRGKLVKAFTGSVWTHVSVVLEARDDTHFRAIVSEYERRMKDRDARRDPEKKRGKKRDPIAYTSRAVVVEVTYHSKRENGLIATPWDAWKKHYRRFPSVVRPYLGTRPFPTEECWRAVERDASVVVSDMSLVSWTKTVLGRYHPSNLLSPGNDSTDERKVSKDPTTTVPSAEKVERRPYYCSQYLARLLQETGVLGKTVKPAHHQPWQFAYGELELQPGFAYGRPFVLEG